VHEGTIVEATIPSCLMLSLNAKVLIVLAEPLITSKRQESVTSSLTLFAVLVVISSSYKFAGSKIVLCRMKKLSKRND
jgi:hypothetical protein